MTGLMTGSDMGSVHSLCFHEGLRNSSWKPYAASSFYSRFPVLLYGTTPFMPQASPPGKSGVSAIFPAIKHQERGPDNRHHASFCFFAGNLVDKT